MGINDGSPQIEGGTDNTIIGNIGDRLKTQNSFDPVVLDAFGRLRVSNPESLFEAAFQKDKQPLLFSEATSGGATATHNFNLSSIDFNTGTTNGASVVFQSKEHFTYHPGKSMLLIITGNLKGEQANVVKRTGLFDEANGVFFQMNGTTPQVVVRSSVSGSPVDTTIDQTNWNIDKMDGTGPSGTVLDWTKQQLLFIDFQWLGSGSIRYGTIVGGRLIYGHEVFNSNVLDVPWAQFAQWPIRNEVVNTGVPSSAGVAHLTCATVISEGGWSPEGHARSVSRGTSEKSVGSETPVLSLRKQSAHVKVPVKVTDLSVFSTSSDRYIVRIRINPTLTGASWVNAEGVAQYDMSATAVTGGTLIYTTYFNAAAAAESLANFQELFSKVNTILGSDLAGNSDIITITAEAFVGTGNITAAFNYVEIL